MKLFLAGVLLLASLPSLVMADEPGSTEVLVFASNPQPACPRCVPVNVDLTKANVEAQYKWINKTYTNKENFLGVVVNGNWTAPGFTMFDAEKLYYQLTVPLYFGLGANDYVTNRMINSSSGVTAVWKLSNYIQNNIKTKQNEPNKTVHFDFVQDSAYNKVGIGSLGYAVELGRNKNIYLIQLNDNGNKSDSSSFLLQGNGNLIISTKTFTFKINPIYDWLQTRLEYAAQQNKIIIVSKNSADMDPAIDALLDSYKVNMRFLGVNPESSPLCADNKFICLGYSSEKELLQLTLSHDDGRFSVAKLKADSDYTHPVTNGAIVIHPYYWPKGEFPIQKQVVIFNNYAGYSADPHVTYFDPIKKADVGFEGSNSRLNLNQLFMVDVPKEVTMASQTTGKLTASVLYQPTNVEVLDETKRKNLDASVICIRFTGTFWSRYTRFSTITTSMKMGAGGEKESLNFCPG